MARLNKIFIHGTAVFITTSVEEGILLPPSPKMKAILKSALARAQTLHPVRICHYIVEGTHVHLLAIVDNPDDVKGFMERFKTESAHAINALLGRRKRTIWCEGYDSPVVLTIDDVIRKIAYIYSNPSNDDLEDSIVKYPGLSSWEAFQSGNHTIRTPWFHRPDIVSLSEEGRLSEEKEKDRETLTFTLYPDAWMECFEDALEIKDELNQRIRDSVAENEKNNREERAKTGKKVIGKDRLIKQTLDLSYVPKRSGRKMWCICSNVPFRILFLTWAKALVGSGREVAERWLKGEDVAYPIGLFAPSRPKKGNLVGLTVAFA